MGYPQIGCPSKLVSIRNNRKLEPKLVSALFETKRLFRLLCFYTQIESFDGPIELKQTEGQPKQFDREHILFCFQKILGFFWFYRFFRFDSVVSLLYWNREFRCFDWTETNRGPTQTVWKRVSVFFETVIFVSVVSIKVQNTKTNPTFLFLFSRNKPKHNWNRSCFGSNRNFYFFVSRTPYPQSTYRGRGEIGRVYLPSQLERTLQLCTWW
jgi:hypothetical protein